MESGASGGLNLIYDYKESDKHRSSFNELALSVFGIDFEPWYRAGFWNDRYICCSYAAAGEVVANVSVNMMDLMAGGEIKKAVQIGTVMTRPDHRKKGLSEKLMNFALDRYGSKADLVYLFANESAYGFYPRFGFAEACEASFEFVPELRGKSRPCLRKLDIGRETDLSILKRLAFNRAPVSKKLGVINDSHLIMFYCLNFYAGHIYYSDGLDTAVIYKIENGALYLYDILSERFEDHFKILNLLNEPLSASGAAKIVFMFTPDNFAPDIKGVCEERDYKLFVKPLSCGVGGEFTFPRLSHA